MNRDTGLTKLMQETDKGGSKNLGNAERSKTVKKEWRF